MIRLTIPILLLCLCSMNGEGLKLKTQQISISQRPMNSDSLVLKGALGTGFYKVGSGDTLKLKGGLWNIASGLYSDPPLIISTFPDTIHKNDKQVYAQAIITDLNGIEAAELHYQLGGSKDIVVIPMETVNDSTYRVSIDDSIRSVFNLRAYIVSKDGMLNKSETDYNSPYIEFAKNELTMEDTFSFYPDGIGSESWRMFSFPGYLHENQIAQSSLEDGHVFYDWDPNANTWVKPDSLEIGRGYWFKHRYNDPVIFGNKDTTGFAIPLENYTIQLDKHCNMVGNPFSFPVIAESSEGVSLPFKYGLGTKEGWADTTVFEPWAGYAVYSPSDTGTITFKPFIDSMTVSRLAINGWKLELDVIGEYSFDRTCVIGRNERALEVQDIYDLPSMPSPQNSLKLMIDIGGSGSYEHSSDIRSLDEFNGVWNIQIQGNNEPGPIQLTGSSNGLIPKDLCFTIVDIHRRMVINEFLRLGLAIEEKITNNYDLKLIAGDENYVMKMVDDILADIPEEFTLGQNYPNPFNPTTNIDFALPISGNISLVIYNLMGQEVRTLISKNMKYGFHTILWNGLDQSGRPVSSGVYFSELRAKGFRQTKKMLMLK